MEPSHERTKRSSCTLVIRSYNPERCAVSLNGEGILKTLEKNPQNPLY